MSEMIDRVATALERFFSAADKMDGEHIAAAREAIEAMREPTEMMCDAAPPEGFDIYWCYHADGRPCGQEDVWRAMIDAALTPPAVRA